ncbi:hypothetical protein F4810DRAFT_709096 [Camillea tinctor]|nr:hypothetical protein F4810DRAFT_709096 [Camillea tinctor]
MDKVDGGLSRKRWERRAEGGGDGGAVVSRKATGAIRRVPGKISRAVGGLSARYQQQPPQSSSPHDRNPYPSQISGDGQTGSSESNLHYVASPDSTIYVSIFDPINGPTFKPSPTKPIPRWMQMLPGQRSAHRNREPRPHSVLDTHFRPPSSTISVKTPPHTIPCPTPTTDAHPAPAPAASTSPAPRRQSLFRRRKSRDSPSSHYDIETAPTPFRGHSHVADEPLRRPLSRRPHDDSSSPCTDNAHAPAPHSSPPPAAHPEKRNSPPAFSTADVSEHRRTSPPLTDQIRAYLRRCTPPAQSTEFLSLYRPGAGAGAEEYGLSAAVPGRGRARVVDLSRPLDE